MWRYMLSKIVKLCMIQLQAKREILQKIITAVKITDGSAFSWLQPKSTRHDGQKMVTTFVTG